MGMNPEPIHEYQSFTCNKGNFGTQYVDIKSETTFQNLKQFILESNACGETEALDFMSVSYNGRFNAIRTVFSSILIGKWTAVVPSFVKIQYCHGFA